MSGIHTPGPWVVADGHPDGIIDRAIKAGGYFVATVHDVANDADAWDADARLMAAAPDLLIALARLVGAADGVANYLHSAGMTSTAATLAEYVADGRAVIAKATAA